MNEIKTGLIFLAIVCGVVLCVVCKIVTGG